jgi:phosphoglycerate dehydrogenase-like enzyme
VKRIAALDDPLDLWRQSADWQRLSPRAEFIPFHDRVESEDALAARLRDFEAVVLRREKTPFPASLIDKLPKLQFIATMGGSNRAIDVPAARARGIPVSGALPDLFPVAELAWALILACARNIALEDRRVRIAGKWQTTIGTELRGKTLGLLGLGRIGGETARMGAGFGMKTIAWSRSLTQERASAWGDVEAVGKDDLLARSDFLVVALSGGRETANLLGAREIDRMKRGAYLINISRASCVDQAAMIAALESGKLAGAGLDVFDVEPLPPGHRLLALDNVVIHPHMGNAVRHTQAQQAEQIIENIGAWLDGRPIRLVDDRSTWP